MPIFNSNNGTSSSGYQFPFLGLFDSESETLKNAHDTYDVYVNNEYVGKKIFLTQSEEVEDVVDFLNSQGVSKVSTHLEGDHYMIKSDDPEHVKDILETYLKNR